MECRDVHDVQKECESAGDSTPHHNETVPVVSSFADTEPMMTHFNTSQFQKEGCFTKGCKWAPDGSCILTNSEDNILRIWNLPQEFFSMLSWNRDKQASNFNPVLKMKEGGLIYDYCWYPLMNSWDPASCCVGSVSRDSPTHLWDAFTGQLRATYRAYNQVDEVEAARSLAFDSTGQKLFCGFYSCIRVFDVSIPGRSYSTRILKTSSGTSQTGIVSCITVSPAINSLFAVGTYSGTIGLYVDNCSRALCILQGHEGGLTHLKFSSDGLYLYSGGRQDTEIVCWDLREPGKVLFAVPRVVKSHQRVYFDLTSDGKYLISGTTDGYVCVWDTIKGRVCKESPKPEKAFRAHHDCTNGISMHGQMPIIATTSGQRHHVEYDYSSDEENPRIGKERKQHAENSLKLWWLGPLSEVLDEKNNDHEESTPQKSPLGMSNCHEDAALQAADTDLEGSKIALATGDEEEVSNETNSSC